MQGRASARPSFERQREAREHAAGEEIASLIPGARIFSIKGGGHIAFYTHAEQVNVEIARFLNELREGKL